MKKKAKELLKHPLIYGSAIVVVGSLIANFFNFLFNLFMSRTLTVTDYGILASIISIIGFPALIGNAVVPVVVRFAGDYFATGDLSSLRGFYTHIKKILLIIAMIFFIVFFVFLNPISAFFHIDNKNILILADVVIFITMISVINIAFIQAKLAFVFLTLISLSNTLIKFLLGCLFVFLGVC